MKQKACYLLEQMRANPCDDWRLGDVKQVCRAHDVRFTRGASHYVARAPGAEKIQAIPAHRLVKPHYIRALVALIDRTKKKSRFSLET